MRLLGALMGFLDLNAAILLLAIAFGVEAPLNVLIVIPVLLFLKACICITDIGSIIDLVAVVLIVLSIFITIPAWILFVGAAFIGFKGLRSF